MESDTQVYKYKGKSLDKAGGQMNKVSRKEIGTNIVGRRPYLYLQKAQRRSTKKMVLPKGIDSLWCLSLDSQHHHAIYWAKNRYGNILHCKTSVLYIRVGNFDCKQSCFLEKNFPLPFILPSRW